MKRVYGFLGGLFLLFFAMSFVAGAIESESVDEVIIPQINHPAHFKIIFSGMAAGTYNLYTLADVKLVPGEPFSLPAGESTRDIYVHANDALQTRGFYVFNYGLSRSGNTIEEDKLIVRVVDLKDALEIGSESNAPESGDVTFYVRNREKADIKNTTVTFSSAFFNFTDTIDIQPLGLKEFTIKVGKDKLKTFAAGAYIVKAAFATSSGMETVEGKVYIGERKGISVLEDADGFLIRTETISKTNVGNVPETVTTKMKRNIITRLLTTFNNEPNVVDRQGAVISYTWTAELKPMETLEVRAKTNYIYPLLVIVAVALLIMGFRRYAETKIEVTKSVSPMKTSGGEFALKVRINVKAKSRAENVSIVDRVPAILKIYEKFATRQAPRVDHANRRMQWDLGEMAAGEERQLAYVVYSKVGVVGKFSLPASLAVFEEGGEVHEVESNTVFFLNEQTKRDD